MKLTKIRKQMRLMELNFGETVINDLLTFTFSDVLGKTYIIQETGSSTLVRINDKEGFTQKEVVNWLDGHKLLLTDKEGYEAKIAERLKREEELNHMLEVIDIKTFEKHDYQLDIRTHRIGRISTSVTKQSKKDYMPTILVETHDYDGTKKIDVRIQTTAYGALPISEIKIMRENYSLAIEAAEYFEEQLNLHVQSTL